MVSFKLGLYILVSIFIFHLLPSPVICDDEEKTLLHEINTYRILMNLPILVENEKASCVAEEIATDLDYKSCDDFRDYTPIPGSNPKFPEFQKYVEKCKININTTKDGVIMPVCESNLNVDALFYHFKPYGFSKYLNNSKYTIAGVVADDDWKVLIISTNMTSGNFSAATSLLSQAWKGHCMVLGFFLSVFIVLFN